jgi:electron transfer flavoprotein alpha subunit
MAGKNFLARLGAELDVSPITDVVSVVSTYALQSSAYSIHVLCMLLIHSVVLL